MAELKEAFFQTARYTFGLEQQEKLTPAPAGDAPGQAPAKEAADPYAQMEHWELWMKLASGEITDPQAAKVYLEKAKADELRVARDYDAWAKANLRPDRLHYPIEKIISNIDQKYNPFIYGTKRDCAGFFVQEAVTVLLGSRKSEEARIQANQQATNLLIFARSLE